MSLADLLAAIRQEPDSDDLRLVYADWLGQNGQLERAEFVRLQIESARLPPSHPWQAQMHQRQTTLLGTYASDWLPDGFPWPETIEWIRGLPERVDLTQCETGTGLPVVRPNNQVTDASLAHLRPLENLRAVTLMDCPRLTDSGLVHLAALANLRSLTLGQCPRLTNAGLTHLTSLENLQSLGLPSCHRLTDAGLTQLAALPNLKSVDLHFCRGITPVGLIRLAKRLPWLSIRC